MAITELMEQIVQKYVQYKNNKFIKEGRIV
jgi:hypothetical protein